jgi:hypothetical protein
MPLFEKKMFSLLERERRGMGSGEVKDRLEE